MLTKIWKKAALAVPMATLLFVSLSANAGTITGKAERSRVRTRRYVLSR